MKLVSKGKQDKFIYQHLADDLERKINEGIFSLTEKLPSLRTLRSQTGHSMTTVFQAYVELEKRGVIEARHRSGYYIKPKQSFKKAVPRMKRHEIKPIQITMDTLIYDLTEDMVNPEILKLGGITISPDLMPVKQLSSQLKSITSKEFEAVLFSYSSPHGLESLRVEIVKHLMNFREDIQAEDMLITAGCTEAISMCLRTIAKPGDNIIIESPTDPWVRQLIKDLDLFTLEMPTNPRTGIDIESVEKTIKKNKVSVCLLQPNYQNPLGFVMPDRNKEYLVALMEENSIPIIENDVYGELFFGDRRPKPLKHWDKTGNILYCSSFSKSLSSGLRVGWTMPGIYFNKLKRLKLNLSVTTPTVNQVLISEFLRSGRFERHLRKLRTALKSQIHEAVSIIMQHFPEDIKMTSPHGGFVIWIELPKHISGMDVYRKTRQKKISVLPGFLCSNLNLYNNYIRICCGNPWTKTFREGLITIGKIVTSLAGSGSLKK